jgi:hypothetical protein
MKVLLYLMIVLAVMPLGHGQGISIGFGPTYITDKSEVGLHPTVMGGGVGGNDDWFYQISYSHKFEKKYLASISFAKYPDRTYFHFKNNAGDFGGYGWFGATDIRRIELGFGWNIFHSKKIILVPSLFCGLMLSKPLGVGIGGIIPLETVPVEFEQLEPIEAESFKTNQIVPAVGFKIGYAFWNRLELFLDFRQVLGFRKTQQLTLKYSYQGIVQPDAINFTDGTDAFWNRLELFLDFRQVLGFRKTQQLTLSTTESREIKSSPKKAPRIVVRNSFP